MSGTVPCRAERRLREWERPRRVRRAFWRGFGAAAFAVVPDPFPGLRNRILRLFGAKIGPGVFISRRARIEDPWNLEVGAGSEIQFGTTLDCMGAIRIGERVRISQHANLCAGTHQLLVDGLPIAPGPIEVGDDVWIAADAFVGPNARIGADAVVAARSSAFGVLPPGMVCVGEPARPIKPRRATGSTT